VKDILKNKKIIVIPTDNPKGISNRAHHRVRTSLGGSHHQNVSIGDKQGIETNILH